MARFTELAPDFSASNVNRWSPVLSSTSNISGLPIGLPLPAHFRSLSSITPFGSNNQPLAHVMRDGSIPTAIVRRPPMRPLGVVHRERETGAASPARGAVHPSPSAVPLNDFRADRQPRAAARVL